MRFHIFSQSIFFAFTFVGIYYASYNYRMQKVRKHVSCNRG